MSIVLKLSSWKYKIVAYQSLQLPRNYWGSILEILCNFPARTKESNTTPRIYKLFKLHLESAFDDCTFNCRCRPDAEDEPREHNRRRRIEDPAVLGDHNGDRLCAVDRLSRAKSGARVGYDNNFDDPRRPPRKQDVDKRFLGARVGEQDDPARHEGDRSEILLTDLTNLLYRYLSGAAWTSDRCSSTESYEGETLCVVSYRGIRE